MWPPGTGSTGGMLFVTCPTCNMMYAAGSPHHCAKPVPPPVDLEPFKEHLINICKVLERIANALDRTK